MNSLDLNGFDSFFRGALSNLGKKRDIVNKLNVFPVPDGDTGTNMYLTLKTAIDELDKKPSKNLKEFGKTICEGALIGGRGNSGVILSQILKGFFEVIDNYETIDAYKFAEALMNGSKIAYQAVIKPVEGTILTVMKAMATKAMLLAPGELDFDKFLEKIVTEGSFTLSKTPEMLSVLKEAGVVDAGGQGLIFIFEGGLSGLRGEEIAKTFEEVIEEIDSTTLGEELKFKFDTVILAQSLECDPEVLKEKLTEFGDSIVVAQAGELVKIHVHSNEPYRIIEQITHIAKIKEARVENMQLEQEEFLKKKISTVESRFPFSVIAVAQGEGFKEIFKSLGVENIIEGGQTMNPSINDFLLSIESSKKENVIVFPNNSNVILAAQEAKKMSKMKSVEIVPTANMVQSIPAILGFNAEDAFENNLKHAIETINNIHSIAITYSIRDTKMNGLEIAKDDIIGMFDDEILAKGSNPEDIVLNLLEIKKDIVEGAGFLAVYYGKDTAKEKVDALVEKIQGQFSNIEVDVTYGGQPFYFYLISIE